MLFFRFARMAESLKRKVEKGPSHGGKKIPPWMTGLKDSMNDPELQIYKDDKIIAIKDKYPKARHHFLVLPKREISNLKRLGKEDIPLLKHMEEKGREIGAKSSTVLEFRYGYHAVPSMSQVHLHVISQDFDSPSLKTKKHWNSFTTEYFIDSADVIDMIESNGSYQADGSKYAEILKRALRCHKCDEEFSTIPSLKKHLLRHIPK